MPLEKQTKIAITGATSFTGTWIASALEQNGWTVLAPVRKPKLEYEGIKAIRLKIISPNCSIDYGIDAASSIMLRWIESNRPHIWIHHHHWMEGFQLENYNPIQINRICIDPISKLIPALKKNGCQGVIYSGSYFETRDSPYAQSKVFVWKELQRYCSLEGLPLSKVVIPNPIGPLENADRLIPSLLVAAKKNEVFHIRSPDEFCRQVPVRVLAEEYVKVVKELLEGRPMIHRPLGWSGEVEKWVTYVREKLIEKKINLSVGGPEFENKSINWNLEWDHYAKTLLDLKFEY